MQNNALSQLIVNRIMELRDVETEGARSNIFRSENTALRVPPPPSLESLEHALVEHRRNGTPRKIEDDARRVYDASDDRDNPKARHGDGDDGASPYNERYKQYIYERYETKERRWIVLRKTFYNRWHTLALVM